MTLSFPSDIALNNHSRLSEGDQTAISHSLPSLLVLCVDPAVPSDVLVTFFAKPSLAFNARLVFSDAVARKTCDSAVTLPKDLDHAANTLRAEMESLSNLHLVLVIGVSSHITLLNACGIPLHRMEFHPGHILRLPDGLLLADIAIPPRFTNAPHRTEPLETFERSLEAVSHIIRKSLTL